MASFVMVVNGVTAEQLEKILSIQGRSENKIRFVPQGNQQQGQVISQALNQSNSTTPGTPPRVTVSFQNVRLEWGEDAAHFAEEVFKLFIRHEHREEKAG